jgi:hypothetical protein
MWVLLPPVLAKLCLPRVTDTLFRHDQADQEFTFGNDRLPYVFPISAARAASVLR